MSEENPNNAATAPAVVISPISYAIFATCAGLAVGLMAYRFTAMPFVWHSALSKIFAILPPALFFGTWQLVRKQKMALWPWKIVTACALAGTVLALGVSYLIAPPLGAAKLFTRSLPGFSLEIPKSETKAEILDYAQGRIELEKIADSSGAMNINWEPGTALAPEDSELMPQMIARILGGSPQGGMQLWPGPGNVGVPTFSFSTPRGPAYLSVLVCAGRRIQILSIGEAALERLQRRMLPHFRCQPDAARESLLESLPWTILLPAGWAKVEGTPAGQVQLSDGVNLLLLRGLAGAPKDRNGFKTILAAIFQNSEMKLEFGDWAGNHLNLHGAITGMPVSGWAEPLHCATGDMLLMGISPDRANADRIARLVNANGRCLKAGETPPPWPTSR